MATLGGVMTREETAAQLARWEAHWERYGFGRWSLRDPATGAFVGRGGLMHVDVDGRDEVEVGYALASEFWGKGFATELTRESLRVAFEELALSEVVGFTLTTNRASQRVMERAGFRLDRVGSRSGLPHAFYRLTAAEWRAGRPRP
jgi:RimJ/RimL family protein N-acetyltransferase